MPRLFWPQFQVRIILLFCFTPYYSQFFQVLLRYTPCLKSNWCQFTVFCITLHNSLTVFWCNHYLQLGQGIMPYLCIVMFRLPRLIFSPFTLPCSFSGFSIWNLKQINRNLKFTESHTPIKHYDIQNITFCSMFSGIK